MKSFSEIDIDNNGDYINLLSAVAKLSGLFSDNSIPFINYRVAENIFCRSFGAENLSRSDTAFDARLNSIGVGLKTFSCNRNNSTEKVAEFNSLSRNLADYKGKELAIKLSEYRNDRINLAKRLYNIENSIYHIVARRDGELAIFETDYQCIDLQTISSVKTKDSSLQFEDEHNAYTFNFSKSTLFRKFTIPSNAYIIPVDIIDNPYDIILEILENRQFISISNRLIYGKNCIILPLYGYKNNEKFVFEKSGLNQWNASGRRRDFGEVYIPIPKIIHNNYPNFFPSRDDHFNLKVPSGEVLSAKICQDNGKALMTNPNNALSDWLLRKVLNVNEGELVTIDIMNNLGFDSVHIIKDDDKNYRIDKSRTNSFEKFIEKQI